MLDQTFPISVVICVYNAEKYLAKALKSICDQSYKNLEILVIDDASTDASASIAVAMAQTDQRIRLIKLEQNGGIAHARQVGLESARNNWLLFLDADDIALPTMIEKQVAILNSDKNIIGVSTYSYICDENEHTIGIQRVGIISKYEFIGKYKKNKLVFILPNTLFSKPHALLVGGYRLKGFPINGDVRYQDFSEDVDLWCRLADYGKDGKYLITIPEPLFLYRKTTSSLSSTNVFRMQEKMRWIKDCLICRRNGLPEKSFDDYRKSLPTWQRVKNIRSDYAAFFYKKMAFCYLRHQYAFMIPLFAVVCLLDPRLVLQKMRIQKRRVIS